MGGFFIALQQFRMHRNQENFFYNPCLKRIFPQKRYLKSYYMNYYVKAFFF